MSKKYLSKVAERSSVASTKVSSAFGEKMLKQMGWSEGQGLGKTKTGQVQPLQVRKRKENLGLGADPSKQKWNHNWWEELFNDTAEKIQLGLPKKKIKTG